MGARMATSRPMKKMSMAAPLLLLLPPRREPRPMLPQMVMRASMSASSAMEPTSTPTSRLKRMS